MENELELLAASSEGRLQAVKLLLQQGASANSCAGQAGDTALHMATKGGHVAVVLELLRAGADPTSTNQAGKTAAEVACSRGTFPFALRHDMKVLLEVGLLVWALSSPAPCLDDRTASALRAITAGLTLEQPPASLVYAQKLAALNVFTHMQVVARALNDVVIPARGAFVTFGSPPPGSSATMLLADYCEWLIATTAVASSSTITLMWAMAAGERQAAARAVMQLLACPDFLDVVVRRPLCPAIQARAAAGDVSAAGCRAVAHQLLTSLDAIFRAFLGRSTPEHRVWEGLQQRFAAVLTSDGNLPYLVDVLDTCMATGSLWTMWDTARVVCCGPRGPAAMRLLLPSPQLRAALLSAIGNVPQYCRELSEDDRQNLRESPYHRYREMALFLSHMVTGGPGQHVALVQQLFCPDVVAGLVQTLDTLMGYHRTHQQRANPGTQASSSTPAPSSAASSSSAKPAKHAKKASTKRLPAPPPLPCTPAGYQELLVMLEELAQVFSSMASLQCRAHHPLLLERWRLLDWMDLRGPTHEAKAPWLLCCLASFFRLPSDVGTWEGRPILDDGSSEGPQLRARLIDEVARRLEAGQLRCLLTAPQRDPADIEGQRAVLVVYSAVSGGHPAAVPAAAYRQLIRNAMADRTANRRLSLPLGAQALAVLIRRVQLQEKEHSANTSLAMDIIKGSADYGAAWVHEALQLLARVCISSPAHRMRQAQYLSPALAGALAEALTGGLDGEGRSASAAATQLLWLLCGQDLTGGLPVDVWLILMSKEAATELMHLAAGAKCTPCDMEEADLDPAVWPHLPPGQRIQRMAADVLLVLLWRGCVWGTAGTGGGGGIGAQVARNVADVVQHVLQHQQLLEQLKGMPGEERQHGGEVSWGALLENVAPGGQWEAFGAGCCGGVDELGAMLGNGVALREVQRAKAVGGGPGGMASEQAAFASHAQAGATGPERRVAGGHQAVGQALGMVSDGERQAAAGGTPDSDGRGEKRQCEVCKALQGGDGELLLCSGCMGVRYCSRECQKQHWKRHKKECKRVDKG